MSWQLGSRVGLPDCMGNLGVVGYYYWLVLLVMIMGWVARLHGQPGLRCYWLRCCWAAY